MTDFGKKYLGPIIFGTQCDRDKAIRSAERGGR